MIAEGNTRDILYSDISYSEHPAVAVAREGEMEEFLV